MTDSHQFFNFAALIIPVLLFGGAVSDRWKPKTAHPDHPLDPRKLKKLALGVWGAMVLALVAEVIAIIAAFGGVPEKGERIYVGIVMVAGTVAAAGAIAWPWLEKIANPQRRNAVIGGVAIGGVLTLILLLNTVGTPPKSGEETSLEKKLAAAAAAQQRSSTSLSEAANATSATSVTLRNALHALASEAARIKAQNAALIRAVERS